MPHSKSAKKRLRQSKERRVRNKAQKTKIHNLKKKFFSAIEREEEEEAREHLRNLTTQLHRAARKGVMHENKAARKQAQFEKKLNEMLAAEE